MEVTTADTVPEGTVERLRPRRSLLALKRLTDVSVALLALILLAPIQGAVALAVLVDSGPPVLFRTRRIGRGGRPFTMYKFRTMVPDAEERLPELLHLNAARGMVKIPGDPRVTRVGRWLRRFSLDELPQLWNVLRGDMSLVGPRPHGVDEDVPWHEPAQRLRLTMRPGLTGLWQVSARSNPLLSVRVHYDILYLRSWSLRLDLRLLLQTVPAIVKGQGDRVQEGAATAPLPSRAVRLPLRLSLHKGRGWEEAGAVEETDHAA